jgi:hypothetical protein
MIRYYEPLSQYNVRVNEDHTFLFFVTTKSTPYNIHRFHPWGCFSMSIIEGALHFISLYKPMFVQFLLLLPQIVFH